MEQVNLNIGSIGQKLEAARRAKGVTVSEAGQATKILAKFIEAMESDDFGALSAPVYAKSFIRMYAQYLGLEPSPLVDEYVSQHAPKSKNHLSEDVRQKLAQSDQVTVEPGGNGTSAQPAPGKRIFEGVGATITQLPVSASLIKKIVIGVIGIVVLGLIVFSVKQCVGGNEEEPTAVGGAASVEHRPIPDAVPDTYLVRPGEIEVDR
ncbi:MAG: helix-turn-helix domain-containing protein [Pontiellaceae bacterium]|nr:helix-turn-helix domain-containing protein [Pontiellaceae bacterium]MBN2784769.1 helix-turn-helix domain-containing protein [Pontiellaceae bacterium]